MSKDSPATRPYAEGLDAALQRIVGQLVEGDLDLIRFTRSFYAKTPLKELTTLQPNVAAQMARHAYAFFQRVPGGEPKIELSPAPYTVGLGRRARSVLKITQGDMPFLIDSTMATLARLGYEVYESIHPVLHARRDEAGNLTDLPGDENQTGDGGGRPESLIYAHISTPVAGKGDELVAEIRHVLKHVAATVSDWRAMEAKARELRDRTARIAKGFDAAEIDETVDFLDWLCAKNFVFLGMIDVDYVSADTREANPKPETRLGILRVDEGDNKLSGLSVLSADPKHLTRSNALIEINKTNTKAIVHRPVYMDYIALKRFSDDGSAVGETRMIGLFTSLAYYQAAEHIPFIRRKIARVLEQAGYDPVGHNGKALRAILEFFPRDELLQTDDPELFDTALGILSLEARPDLGLFLRRDPFERYVACLVYLPRDRFNTYIRQEIAGVLADAFEGSVSSFYTQMTNSPLARLHYIIKTPPGALPKIDQAELESRLRGLINAWPDALHELLVEERGETVGETLFRDYGHAFPKDYVNRYPAASGVADIAKMESLTDADPVAFQFYAEENAPEYRFRLKIYSAERESALSDLLPILENMGFSVIDVHPYVLKPTIGGASKEILLRDFILDIPALKRADYDRLRPLIEDALERLWDGTIENDGYNALVAAGGLDWQKAMVLRAYGRYLKQVGLPYSQNTLSTTLAAHPETAARLVELFALRFDPETHDDAKADALQEEITASLGAITVLSEDRIIRRFLGTIGATLRTNFYQTGNDGKRKPYLSFKLDSKAVPELPRPKPYAEIFVYSPRVEGIHLRGGKVARGGLRWSDRPDDFRTEILGLMKAQQVKNAVIVPVGSKGGFVLKQAPSPSERDAWMAEGVACYKLFLSGLLDLTDNLDGSSNVITPPQVVRRDGDDPYLVVAADKGTATFSDYANGVSKDYGFWLGDAFASGGSAGYDHKAMGITARGAWVSVRRHFREMGKDIQAEDFTCVGIGDMAGDVFGNGMLLSEHTRLLAAFNHLHIFLDPNPDAARSFVERKRLFEKPRSAWTDYDASLISKGGGVFERKAKSIPLSPEVQAMLGVTEKSLAPDELIRALLTADVDLLWNGGIGTYVKAEAESNDDVGDRANDPLRVNGSELRAKVVGEGGNLGFTQKGRIEYARTGGRINTDAIDNSAGVDTSDHEVNIKIALSKLALPESERDSFLSSMTDDVAKLVLRDNQLQTQALSVAEQQGGQLFDAQVSLMQRLERKGLLDRGVEFLPTDKQISALRAEKRGLTRPELAVLLAYAKMALYNELLASDLPDQPYFEADLLRYFPPAMAEKYADAIRAHALRREIVATVLTNSMINRTGIAFLHGIAEDSGRDMSEIARAYVVARDAFGLRDLWYEIEALDGTAPASVQVEMFAAINAFLEHMIFWLLIHAEHPLDIEKTVSDFRPIIEKYRTLLADFLPDSRRQGVEARTTRLTGQGVAPDLASRIAGLDVLSSAADVAKVALDTHREVPPVGEVYFLTGERFGLAWLRELASAAPTDSHWDRLALKSLIGQLYATQRRLTREVIEHNHKEDTPAEAVERFVRDHEAGVVRYERLLRDLKGTETRHIPMLVIALQQLGAL